MMVVFPDNYSVEKNVSVLINVCLNNLVVKQNILL